jgi:peptidoglycan hydrolase-like protein with peptidoglycan-binding domain
VRKILLFLLLVWAASSLWADDLTRTVQQRLKDQGFYYGEVDGRGGDETSAAIRRFQIRHGLKVTGQPNDETLRSLGVSGGRVAGPAPGDQESEGYSNDRHDRQSPGPHVGRPFSGPEGPEDYNEMQEPPFVAPRVVSSYPQLFAGTIYERSPARIQENVLYAVQGELMRSGFFRGVIDGRLGPATSNAIVRLQQSAGLPVNGRLDNETLDMLQAFPGQRNGPPEGGFR